MMQTCSLKHSFVVRGNTNHTHKAEHAAKTLESAMGRGRGKGKRGGRGGGGRQHFVSSLEELESRNDRDEAWAARRKAEREANSDDDEDGEGEKKKEASDKEESEEDSSEGEEGGVVARGGGGSGGGGGGGEVDGLEAMAENKLRVKGVSALIEVENPNAKPKAGRMMKAKVSFDPTPLLVTTVPVAFAVLRTCTTHLLLYRRYLYHQYINNSSCFFHAYNQPGTPWCSLYYRTNSLLDMCTLLSRYQYS